MARPLKEALASGGFLVAASVDPPKGTDLVSLGQLIGKLKGVVDALGVSDNHSGSMHMSPWAVCKLAIEQDVEPIMTMACRDRNRIALQSDLLAAASLGIKNVLCVSGDHISFGDHADAKPVHDIDSVHLLAAAGSLNEGRDMAGNALGGATDFFVGAVANPHADPIEPQLMKVDKKIKAGAAFLVTHPVFNIEHLAKFMEHVRGSDVKVLAGVRLLVPEEVPQYRDGRYPGLFVPDNLLGEIEGANMAKCVEAAGGLIKEIKSANLCDGVYITAPGYEEMIQDLL
ncbi:MAG: methylenetetrahydrofolate reductase [Deltaproteobacteria bacterium]|nr:methylenetetrahydrofolate reductase [Deltaproteobacteria bacterium]